MSCDKNNQNLDRQDPEWDYAAEAAEHLAMAMENALDLFGRPTTIYAPVVQDTPYSHVYDDTYGVPPEYVEPTEYANPNPTGRCKVLLGQPLRGLPISDFISLSDKFDAEVEVRTNTDLPTESIILVEYPNKVIRIRILRGDGVHADTYIIYKYIGVVCGPE